MKFSAIKISLLLLLILALPVSAISATYYVQATGGDDARSSAVAQSVYTPWATVTKCAQTAVAGDICIVRSGTYNEIPSPTNSGSGAGGYITFTAYSGETPVIRGFNLASKDYIKINGFEVTHDNGTYSSAITMSGSDYCEITNNYIHHVKQYGIRCAYGDPCSYGVYRGNRIEYTGCATGDTGNCVGQPGISSNGSHMLIEYNSISHVSDYITSGAEGSAPIIVRNNYFGLTPGASPTTSGGSADCSASGVIDFPDVTACPTDYCHIDAFQPTTVHTPYLFERNFQADNAVYNSHGVIDEVDSQRSVIRENVFLRSGTSAQLGLGDYHYWYNNTIVDAQSHKTSPASYVLSIYNNSVNNYAYNNIYYAASNTAGEIYGLSSGGAVNKNYDCWYVSGDPSETNDVNGDPKFTTYASDVLSIGSDSACKAMGTTLTTITSEGGSGTSFVVEDSFALVGGWGITDATGAAIGDKIIIGVSTNATITDINYATHTVTVSESVSWSQGSAIRLSHMAATPDAGAYPYYASTYALTGTYALSEGTVTVTPSDANLVRYVEVFENGISKGVASTSPYTVSGIGAGTLSVKMYSLYASKTPVVAATSETRHTVTYSVSGPGGSWASSSLGVDAGSAVTQSLTITNGYKCTVDKGACDGSSCTKKTSTTSHSYTPTGDEAVAATCEKRTYAPMWSGGA